MASIPPGARVAIDNAYLGVTPLISGTLLPGAHRVRVEADGRFPWTSQVDVRAGQDLGINLTEANLPRRRRWPGHAAYGSAGLAAAAAAAGGFLGVLSQVNPSGETREAAQRDLSQKRDLAVASTTAFVSAGALGLLSGVLFLVYQDDIFGHQDP